MAIDYSIFSISKGVPRKVAKDARKRIREAIDEEENVKVRARSGGRCEVTVSGERCKRRAWQIHHQLSGIGVRGRGESALARRKTHCCSGCHTEITGKTLQHVRGQQYRKVT